MVWPPLSGEDWGRLVEDDSRLLRYLGDWEEFEITIFTKWGEKIWKTNDPEQCWVGNVNVKDSNGFFYVEDEMYFYKIFARRGTTVKDYTGTVTVLR